MNNEEINTKNLIDNGFNIRLSGHNWNEYIFPPNATNHPSIVVYLYDDGTVSVYPNSQICPYAKNMKDVKDLIRMYIGE